ncbi:hypothetical protein LIER_37459 [Lithospermum erythrorhizon]|uniref:RNase H type-1 domain-containing protein n=1 Tax=Lithospermum erythrorhizon TaxID=34254 RepID=A0AAV3PLW8_LITER
MEPPNSYKEVQKLTGCLAALNRLISKSGERNLLFFQKPEADVQGKLLSRPESGESLQLYLKISDVAVSSVLIRKIEGAQKPIYHVSHVLWGTEKSYPIIDKAAFALIISARKLKAYFESHPIQVVTDQPLKRVLTSPALSGRLTTWAIELNEFEISYIPRTTIKAYALAEFVIECTARAPPKVQTQSEEQQEEANEFEWSMHVDGARNDKGVGAGVLITGPQGVTMEYTLRFLFHTTNNEAEYETMIVGLKLVSSLNIAEVLVKGDSNS